MARKPARHAALTKTDLLQVRLAPALKIIATEVATRKGMTLSALARTALEDCIKVADAVLAERQAAELAKAMSVARDMAAVDNALANVPDLHRRLDIIEKNSRPHGKAMR